MMLEYFKSFWEKSSNKFEHFQVLKRPKTQIFNFSKKIIKKKTVNVREHLRTLLAS